MTRLDAFARWCERNRWRVVGWCACGMNLTLANLPNLAAPVVFLHIGLALAAAWSALREP